jgi:hypothetical protein
MAFPLSMYLGGEFPAGHLVAATPRCLHRWFIPLFPFPPRGSDERPAILSQQPSRKLYQIHPTAPPSHGFVTGLPIY